MVIWKTIEKDGVLKSRHYLHDPCEVSRGRRSSVSGQGPSGPEDITGLNRRKIDTGLFQC